MLKKIGISVCAILASVSFLTAGLSACGKTPNEPSSKIENDQIYLGDWNLSGRESDYYFLTKDNTLSATLTETAKSVSVGTLITIDLPIIIDGTGNCLDVSYSVKTRESKIAVAVSGGSFFAMSSEGYEIVYTVSTLDKTEHTFSQTISVTGADNLYTEGNLTVELQGYASTKTTRLIELKADETQYDLKNLMTDEQKTVLENNRASGEVVWRLLPQTGAEIVLDGSEVDFSKIEKAYYVVVAEVRAQGVTTIFFADTVDFYSPSEGLVWNTFTDDLSKVTLYNCTDNTDVSIVTDVKGMTGKFYRVTSGEKNGQAEGFAFMFNPLHSLEYYKMFEMENYKLSYMFYLEAEHASEEILGVFGTIKGEVNGVELSTRRQFWTNRWNTVTLSVKDYMQTWETMSSFEALYFIKNNTANASKSVTYFGEFTLESDLKVAEGSEVLVDVADKTTYDLTKLMTAEQAETVSEYAKKADIEWSLQSVTGKTIVAESSTLDLSEISTMSYVVTAKVKYTSYSLTVFVGGVDFYDSSKPVEWGTAESGSVSYYGGAAGIEHGKIDISTAPDVAGDRTGNYYKVVKTDENATTRVIYTFSPVHSKAYYELYKDELEKFTFNYDMYVSAEGKVNGEDVTVTKFGGTVARDDGYENGGFKGLQIPVDKWNTYAVSLKTLYDNWGKYVAGNDTGIHIYMSNNVYYYNDSGKSNYTYKGTYTIYFGNANVSIKMDELSAGNQLIDVKGMPSYDLTNLLSAEDKAKFNSYSDYGDLVWTLTNSAGKVTTIKNLSTVDFNEVAARYYTIEAKIGANTVVTGSVDFYDNTNGIVWNVVEEGGYAKGGQGTVEITSDTNLGGKTGSYYKYTSGSSRGWVVVTPIHSQAYYNQFKDKIESLSIETYCVETDKTTGEPVTNSTVTNVKTSIFMIGDQDQTKDKAGKWLTTTTTSISTYIDTYFDKVNIYGSVIDYQGFIYNNGSWGTDWETQITTYFGNVTVNLKPENAE